MFWITSNVGIAADFDVEVTFYRPGDEIDVVSGVFVDDGAGRSVASIMGDVGKVSLEQTDDVVVVYSHVESTVGFTEELQSTTRANTYVRLDVDRPTLVDVWIEADSLYGTPLFELTYPGNRAHYAYDFYDGFSTCNFPLNPPPEVPNMECTSYASLGYMADWNERILLEPGSHMFVTTVESSFHGRYRIPIDGHSVSSITTVLSQSYCDANGDARCDAGDIDFVTDAILEGSYVAELDLNLNGQLDTTDRELLIRAGFDSKYGDGNLDGVFDPSDLIEVFKAGKYERFVDAGWAEGDWNGDRRFGTADLIFALANSSYLARAEPAAVPEPTALSLCGVAVLLMGRWRRHHGRNILAPNSGLPH